MQNTTSVEWELAEVASPSIAQPVAVVAARDIPYLPGANRLQNLSIYLPKTPETSALVGTPAQSLPASSLESPQPQYHVHVHGGAWRAPQLNSSSIEAAVAHAFSTPSPIAAIVSLNYTLSPYPTHPELPYDPVRDNHADPAREAVHPAHVRDVVHAFGHLRGLGLADGSFVLTGHSCGACLAHQAVLQAPAHWGLDGVGAPPRPAALVGLNGLYDLPGLVHGLGASHEWLRAEYAMLLGIAFGQDEARWPAASPALLEVEEVAAHVARGAAPRLVLLDQSTDDQLVPMSQTERLEAHLAKVSGMKVVRGHRCTGRHAAPWEEGYMIWQTVQDVLQLLAAGDKS